MPWCSLKAQGQLYIYLHLYKIKHELYQKSAQILHIKKRATKY